MSNTSLVIVTGLSGAGKSVVINTLEDMGFYCIDNLPLELLEAAVGYMQCQTGKKRHLTVGIDVRSEEFLKSFEQRYDHIKKKISSELLFLSADDDSLLRRYSSTRRPHPFGDEESSLLQSIQKERQHLKRIEEVSDLFFDTTSLSPHDLSRYIEKRFKDFVAERRLNISVFSFSFQKILPRQIDCLFDTRCLSNPHYIPELRELNGRDSPVIDFLDRNADAQKMLQNILNLLHQSLPLYYHEGKHYLNIGIGCTGGQHRSVYFAEKISASLRSHLDPQKFKVFLDHREL